MKSIPKIGYQFERTFRVEERHLIQFADEQMPAVLATPLLIGELERTAREAVEPHLEPHERTVGTVVEVRHLAPCTLGWEVICLARVLGHDAGEIIFQVEARDAIDLIARGMHRRRVVDAERLRRRVQKKELARKLTP